MERLKLALLYDVVGEESKGVFLGANDFTLGSEEPSQYCYLSRYHESKIQNWFVRVTSKEYCINPALVAV
jgi:hypothetical protein